MSSEEQKTSSEHPSVKNGTDLTVGSIPRHLIAFSLPMLAGSAIQTMYGIVNAVWVGKGLGTTAMAAVTESFPVFFILMAVAGGLTMAANILAAQSYGAKDWSQFRRVVNTSIVLTAVVALGFTAVGHLFAEWLLRIMDTPAEVLPAATSYLRVFLWSMPLMFGMFAFASLLRATGDSRTPVYFQAIFVVVNAILDPLFMFGWIGFPKLGLNGTAVATIITNTGALLAIVLYLRAKRHIIAPDWKHLRADWNTSILTLKIGFPSMIQQALVAMGMMVIIGLVNAFGENGTAAAGAAMRIDQLAFMPAMTIGMAVSTLSGQNIGARQFHRVREVFRWGLVIGCGITLLSSAIVVSIPGILLQGFLRDPAVIAIGVTYLRIVGSAYILFAIMFVSNGVINGAGHTFATTLITLIGLWGVRVPLATYLSKTTHRIEGIWYAMVIGFAVGMAISLLYYFSGRWMRPVARNRVPVPADAPDAEQSTVRLYETTDE